MERNDIEEGSLVLVHACNFFPIPTLLPILKKGGSGKENPHYRYKFPILVATSVPQLFKIYKFAYNK